MRGQPGQNTRLHARLPPSFQGMDHLTTERSFDVPAMWVIDVLVLFFDMLFMGLCTTRQWQTTGRLVKKLNVCTVRLHMVGYSLCHFSYPKTKPGKCLRKIKAYDGHRGVDRPINSHFFFCSKFSVLSHTQTIHGH